MTRRAIILGLLGAAFIAGATYFNDNVLRQSLLVGNHMPHSVYGLLLIAVLLINPTLSRLRPRWRLTGAELAVILALTLSACAIPGAGLMRFFTNAVMLPQHKERSRPGWQSEEVLRMVPEHMLAGTSPRFRSDDFPKADALVRSLTGGSVDERFAEARARVRGLLWISYGQTLAPPIQANEDRTRRLLPDVLNSLLEVPELYDHEAFADVALPKEAVDILARELRLAGADEALKRPQQIVHLQARDVRTLNRHLLDSCWPGLIRSHAERRHAELTGFLSGIPEDSDVVSLRQIPWSAWVRPLAFWLPLVLILSLCTISLSLVLHRQWCDHEHLHYPVARFASALLPDSSGEGTSLIRNRLFLTVAGLALGMHLVNYAYVWWPGIVVPVKTRVDFSGLQPLFPLLEGPVARWALFTGRIFLAVVGLSYFVASDVSISLAAAPVLSMLIGGLLARYNVPVSGRGLYSGSPTQVFRLGAYLGILFMFLYTGRRYYLSVLRRALGRRSHDDVDPGTVWAARMFLGCMIVFAGYLTCAGIVWYLAVAYTLLAVSLFAVMSRIVAETGLFFLEPRWYPCAFLVAMLGIRAVGPSTALLMYLMSTVLLVVPREALMPFVANSLKVLDSHRVPLGRSAAWCAVAVVVALAVAVPMTLKLQYGSGTHHWDAWGTGAVPRYAFDKTVEHKQHLRAVERVVEAGSGPEPVRLSRISPRGWSVAGFSVGLIVVLMIAAARLRWPWWPVHPVILVGFWNYPCVMFWNSFLIGWMIKTMVMRYGGEKLHRKVAPAMLGLVAGDMLGILIPGIIGAIYYFATGSPAPAYLVMPD